MQKLFTKTVYIGTSNQTEQFSKLKIGQWCKGIALSGKAMVWRGQYMGLDNNQEPIINFRLDYVKTPLNWKSQFKSNKSLRDFARIKC
jgi:hypothetical protein